MARSASTYRAARRAEAKRRRLVWRYLPSDPMRVQLRDKTANVPTQKEAGSR